MRIFIKGGTWKNYEDEVLKAAVMKYGKNEWARIASLLPRKSAKQCKARWYEWLDPSIKKTEWTKEEEEKLLHLAKLMPCQWRTIAPIVGRTAHQCLEHYEKLLDQAQEKDEDMDPTDDPRRMRPGEIDPNPHTKPPRPDPLDMDDDEKEMLNEARARLANTRGKKAKRKAREKQLEHARRLAAVQKRRELKAAGIDIPGRRRLRKGIDYATETPFFKEPPPGVFDTSDELKRRAQDDQHFQNFDLAKFEGPNRTLEERKAREEDKKKMERRKQKDLPAHFADVNKHNDPAGFIKRSDLVMPAPQVTEAELEQLHKLGPAALEQIQAQRASMDEKTPQTADTVRMEAENLAKMRNLQTPLLGGETPQLNEKFSDFKGLTPHRSVQATPNIIAGQATPRTAAGVGATPMRGMVTPGATPAMHGEMSATEERARRQYLARQVESSLKSLPAPKDRVSIGLESTEEELERMTKETKEEVVVDQADVDKAKVEQKKKIKAIRLSRQTKAVQRGLPRPFTAPSDKDLALPDPAVEMLEREILKLVAYDSHANPLGKKPSKLKVNIEEIDSALLDAAAKEIEKEEAALKRQSPFFREKEGAEDEFEFADMGKIMLEWDLSNQDYIFVPNPPRILPKRECTTSDRLNAVKHEFDVVRNHMARAAEQANKLEKKVEILTGGYLKRCQTLAAATERNYLETEDLKVKLNCYAQLRQLEQIALKCRLQRAQDEVEYQRKREVSLQAAYASAKADVKDLEERVALKRRREEEEAEAAKLDRAELAALAEEMKEEGEKEAKKPRKLSAAADGEN